MLYLTNFSHSALLYFPQLAELNKLRTFIAKWVIQLNFTGQFEILDKIGEGSFSKVRSYLSRSTSPGNWRTTTSMLSRS